MDVNAGELGGSSARQTGIALGLGFAFALVAGLSASALRVPDAPSTIACYVALANDLTPLLDPGTAAWNPACPSP